MEQSSPSLMEEIQNQLPRYSIINFSTDSPLILEYSHFENSCEFLSPLPLYSEQYNYVLDNMLCSYLSVEHIMDIDQFILGQETKT